MASFRIDIPADPSWLHVARATAVHGAAALGLPVEVVDDITLAVGEAMLEVCVTPGITELSLTAEPSDDGMGVHISGRGEEIEYAHGVGTVVDAVLNGLTVSPAVRRGSAEYSIRFAVTAR